jgi:hypothetical protein
MLAVEMERLRRRPIQQRVLYARLALAALLAISLFSANARAGSLYFFCSAMGEVRSERCCAPAPRTASTERELLDCPCCQAHRVDRLPNGTSTRLSTPDVTSPGAHAPAVLLEPLSPRLAASVWTRRPPTGPPRVTDTSRLMVFRN